MTQTIQNGISSLENLFAVNSFRIPQYQRAYSWVKDPHLEAFLEDLRLQVTTQKKNPEKNYFLGTLLLHEEDVGGGRRVVNVVDGQQRMTTSVVFIATALAMHADKKISVASENPALLRRNFVHDEATGCQKFRTIDEDGPFFQSMILRISAGPCPDESPSSSRLKEAASYFEENVQPEEWESLIRVLKTAKVMVYAVASAEDATQIFELQNDRGKPLTSLEALKSYLMHCIYLHHSAARADDRLAAIQTQFATIYRSVETLAECKWAPDENQVLSYHCAAFLKWSSSEFNDPKHLVKETIKKMEGVGVVSWIENFVSALVASFKTIEELFARRNKLPEFSQLLLLGRMAPFWPMILKTWQMDSSPRKEDFLKTCRLLEVFTFRGYAVANLRFGTGSSTFYIDARDFAGAFGDLFQKLVNFSLDYNLEERFEAGLDNSYFYYAEGNDALYLLWRYENYLRDQRGRIQPLLTWSDFAEPRSDGAKLSVEHVAARGNPMSETEVEWAKGELKPFHEVALNRLGNLVIDSVSPNASKGKKDFAEKLKSLFESSYLSQSELVNFLENREVLVWDVVAIRSRHDHLIKFAKQTWNPKTWHQP